MSQGTREGSVLGEVEGPMLFTSTQLTFTLLFLCSPYFSMCSPTISDILQCPQLLPILLWSSLSSVNTEVSAWTSRENRSHQVKTPSPSSGSSDSPTALVPDCFGLNFLPQLLELTTSTFLDLSSCFPIHGSFFPPITLLSICTFTPTMISSPPSSNSLYNLLFLYPVLFSTYSKLLSVP